MDGTNGFNVHFIAHYAPTNKIWGWMTTDDITDDRHAYAFWSVVGKTISFKRHPIYHIRDFGRGYMRAIEEAKIGNKYVAIDMEELLRMWPDFMESLSYRYTFMQLSNGFDR